MSNLIKISVLRRFLLSILIFFSLENFSFAYDRIVSLSPSGTEIIFALGLNNKLVARTDFCTFPEEA
jgi:ABC-type hemin transport system substrate-binding protein